MDVLEAIIHRRSINFFEKDKNIPEEKLEKLLEIANLAPSSFNLQPWKIVLVNDPERKKILKECAFNQPKVQEASVVLIMVADPSALEENIERMLDSWQALGYMKEEMRESYKKMAYNLYGEPNSLRRKLFAVKNTSLFAMNLMIAAKGLDLDTHPMDGFDEECIKREFRIPEDKSIPMLIAIGYLRSGITLLPRAWRRNIKEFVKYNFYD